MLLQEPRAIARALHALAVQGDDRHLVSRRHPVDEATRDLPHAGGQRGLERHVVEEEHRQPSASLVALVRGERQLSMGTR